MGELLAWSFSFGALIFVIVTFFRLSDFLGLVLVFWMLGGIPAALYLSYKNTKERLAQMEKKLDVLLAKEEEQAVSE